MFSCDICEIFKEIYFDEHLRMTASVLLKMFIKLGWCSKEVNVHVDILAFFVLFYAILISLKRYQENSHPENSHPANSPLENSHQENSQQENFHLEYFTHVFKHSQSSF